MMTGSRISDLLRLFLGRFADQGFTAREERDEVVIEHDGEIAGRVASSGANAASMQSLCLQHQISCHGVSY